MIFIQSIFPRWDPSFPSVSPVQETCGSCRWTSLRPKSCPSSRQPSRPAASWRTWRTRRAGARRVRRAEDPGIFLLRDCQGHAIYIYICIYVCIYIYIYIIYIGIYVYNFHQLSWVVNPVMGPWTTGLWDLAVLLALRSLEAGNVQGQLLLQWQRISEGPWRTKLLQPRRAYTSQTCNCIAHLHTFACIYSCWHVTG